MPHRPGNALQAYTETSVLLCLLLAVASAAFGQSAPSVSPAPAKPAPVPRSSLEQAVEEFRIQTRELGLRGDSPATGKRRARGNQWHGRVFENFRNDLLDATPHEIIQFGGEKNLLRRNQFGFNVAGPVVIPWVYNGGRNTFFSLSYEGVRERISRNYLRTIPRLPERTGDFSATVDQAGNSLPIYDPASTRPNPAYDPGQPVSEANLQYARDPFPGNILPATRLDPVAQQALAYYPAPNSAAGPFFRNNYFAVTPETNIANGVIAKVDHTIDEKHRGSVEITNSTSFLGTASLFNSIADPNPPDVRFSSRRGSLDYIYTRSARTINTLSLEVSSESSRSVVEPGGIGDALGVPSDAFPVLQFSPYVGMGRPAPDARNTRNLYTLSNSLSTRVGKHNLRVNGSLTRWQVNTYSPRNPAGLFRFTEGLTSLPGIINTGHAFASYLLGLSDYSEVSLVGSPSYFRRWTSALSVRDQIELKRNLNVSFSLNMESSTPRVERYNRQATVDLRMTNPENGRLGALVFAGQNGQPRAFQPVRVRVEPSLSLSWNPRNDPQTVVRLTAYRSYQAIPIYYGQWGTQGYNAYPTFISPNVQLQPAVTLSAGLPLSGVQVPNLRPEAANYTIAELMDRSSRQPVSNYASLLVERQLPGALLLAVGAYVSHGSNQLVGGSTYNLNAIPLTALAYRDQLNTEAFRRTLRPYPQYQNFDLGSLYPLGRHRRDAGFLRLEKRASQGLTVNASYEFSKQMDDYSGPYGVQNQFNRSNEWSLTAGSVPHRLSLSYTYELPIGPNHPLLAYTDWRRFLIEGWALSGMSYVNSGDPLAIHPRFNNTGGVLQTINANVVPGVDPQAENPGPEMWFNPAAFEHPDDFSMGNASRTISILSPINQNHDLSVTKRFAVSPERAVEFSAVAFNAINHANWNDPDTVIGPADAPNVNAGKIIGSRGQRVIQLGLRYSF